MKVGPMPLSVMPLPSWIRDLGHGLLDVLYPPRCLGCGGRPETAALPLCPACLRAMERAPLMGVAARLDRLPVAPTALDGALALWTFDKGGALQAVHHALKYGDRPAYGVALGRLIGAAYTDAFPASTTPPPDGVVPIPLHRTRELERGYNQAEALGAGIAEELEVDVRPDLLRRPRATRSQTNLTRADRWKNVRAAFAASEDAHGGSWILVDDVLTTGSTAVAAAQTLKEAGAMSVTLSVLSMART